MSPIAVLWSGLSVLFDTPVHSNRDDSKEVVHIFSDIAFYEDFAHFIVDLAKASMGSMHFLRRGSS
jgi:uncharacterized membrane protein YwzB